MIRRIIIALITTLSASILTVADKATIVHLFEWKFQDIARECKDFLGPYGYGAVQVSPVNEYAVLPGRPWYERYQPFSYKIVSRSGNEEEFKEMIDTCHKAGIKIYVDVVFNHMSSTLDPSIKGSGGSTAITKDKNYPAVPYSYENFHSTCSVNNYQNAGEVRNCELVGLHDLDHSQEYVRTKIAEYLNRLIDLGVDGFRVDASKHMWPGEDNKIFGKVKNLSVEHALNKGQKPFIYQEVIDRGGEAVKASEYLSMGHVTEFKYSSELSRAFRGNNLLKWLKNFGTEWNLMPSEKALVFIDNHDSQRDDPGVLTYKQAKQYKMAVGFMLSWPYGLQRVMSSYSFQNRDEGPPHNQDMSIKTVTTNPDLTCNDGWICEHRWRQIYSMVKLSNIAKCSPVTDFMDNGSNQISFCRGNKAFVAFNGDKYDMDTISQTCLPEGIYCDVVSGLLKNNKCTGKMVTVNRNGTANIRIASNEEDGFLAIHIESKLQTRGPA